MQSILNLIRKNPVIFGFILIVVIFVVFFVLSIFNANKNVVTRTNSSIITPTVESEPTQAEEPTKDTLTSEPADQDTGEVQGELPGEEKERVWDKVDFNENDMNGLNAQKTDLKDGSVQYTYVTDNPNRPDVLIQKNGIIIFQRTSIYGETIKDYEGFLDNPEYSAKGSVFYGPDAVTYIYPNKGTAFVANTKTNQVLEQMTFEPVTITEFKDLYGNDITGAIHAGE